MARLACLSAFLVLLLAAPVLADRSWQSQAQTKGQAIAEALTTGYGYDQRGQQNDAKLKDMFADWCSEYQMSYATTQEQQAAFKIFKQNMKAIQDTNADPTNDFW